MSTSSAILTLIISIIPHKLVHSQSNHFDSTTIGYYQGQNLICNQSLPCTVICDEKFSCQNTTITAPTNSSLMVECSGEHSCKYGTINCPSNHTCTIICSGLYGCASANINPPKNESLFNLTFTGRYALKDVRYPIYPIDDSTPFNLTCTDYQEQCAEMNVICPKQAQCQINCMSVLSCYQVAILINTLFLQNILDAYQSFDDMNNCIYTD